VRVKALTACDVDPLDRFAGAAGQRLVERLRLGGEREDGAVVVGVLVAIEDARAPAAKASPVASRTAASQPPDTLGTARSTLEDVAPGVEHRGVADRQRRVGHHDVEVDRNRHRAADAALAPRRRGSCRGSSVLEDVAGQLGAVVGADTELGRLVPCSPAPVSSS
jgi:hypothetical protein